MTTLKENSFRAVREENPMCKAKRGRKEVCAFFQFNSSLVIDLKNLSNCALGGWSG